MTTTPPKVDIEAFSATDSLGEASVFVRKDDDLDTKFKDGHVATDTTGEGRVAMVLNVDDENSDLIVIDSRKPLVQVLSEIREAAELALDGLHG